MDFSKIAGFEVIPRSHHSQHLFPARRSLAVAADVVHPGRLPIVQQTFSGCTGLASDLGIVAEVVMTLLLYSRAFRLNCTTSRARGTLWIFRFLTSFLPTLYLGQAPQHGAPPGELRAQEGLTRSSASLDATTREPSTRHSYCRIYSLMCRIVSWHIPARMPTRLFAATAGAHAASADQHAALGASIEPRRGPRLGKVRVNRKGRSSYAQNVEHVVASDFNKLAHLVLH